MCLFQAPALANCGHKVTFIVKNGKVIPIRFIPMLVLVVYGVCNYSQLKLGVLFRCVYFKLLHIR